MKLLLDENLPKRLKSDLSAHEVYTVRDMGWNGIENGQPLQLMAENGFDALLTFDKKLQHQQNFKKHTLTVFVLSAPNNTYMELHRLIPQIHSLLDKASLPAGIVIIKEA